MRVLISTISWIFIMCYMDLLRYLLCKVFNQNEVDEGPVYKDVAIIKGIRKACWASKGLATLEAVTARWSEGARNGKVRGAA